MSAALQQGSEAADESEAISEAERYYWMTRSEMRLGQQLTKALQKAQDPHIKLRMADNVTSLLVLLEKAYQRPILYADAIELVKLLHPLPLDQGYGATWEHHLRRAASIAIQLNDSTHQAELLNALSSILYHNGLLRESSETAQQALAAARSGGDVIVVVETGGTLISILLYLDQTDTAVELLNALRHDPLMQDAHGLARVHAQIHLHLLGAVLERQRGELRKALNEADQAVELVERWLNMDDPMAAQVYRNRGLLRWVNGDYTRAVADYEQAIAAFLEQGNKVGELLAHGNLGLAHWSMGQLDRAEQAMRHSVELAETYNLTWELTKQIGDLGLVYLSQGRLAEALTCITRQCDLAERLQIGNELRRALGNRGIVKMHLGDFAAGEADLLIDLRDSEIAKNRFSIANTCANLSRCCQAQGRAVEARHYADRALASAEQLESIDLRVICLRVAAECEPANQTERIALLSKALELARGRRLLDEAACLLSLAALTHGTETQARLWEQGVHLLQQVGAIAWLDGHSLANPPWIMALV